MRLARNSMKESDQRLQECQGDYSSKSRRTSKTNYKKMTL